MSHVGGFLFLSIISPPAMIDVQRLKKKKKILVINILVHIDPFWKKADLEGKMCECVF